MFSIYTDFVEKATGICLEALTKQQKNLNI